MRPTGYRLHKLGLLTYTGHRVVKTYIRCRKVEEVQEIATLVGARTKSPHSGWCWAGVAQPHTRATFQFDTARRRKRDGKVTGSQWTLDT